MNLLLGKSLEVVLLEGRKVVIHSFIIYLRQPCALRENKHAPSSPLMPSFLYIYVLAPLLFSFNECRQENRR